MVVNLVVLGIIGFIVTRPQASPAVATVTSSAQTAAIVNPLDQLSSADIAETVADVVSLPEATAVRNQADTENAELAVTPAENLISDKPQIVATKYASNQTIESYKVQSGDNMASLVSKFDVTSSSIEWSNNLASSNLIVGSTLVIPPVSGIVYTVKSGDTAQSLAEKYGANAAEITSFNDAELSGLTPGEKIVIPNGQIQAPTVSSLNNSPIYSFYAVYGGNGYDLGYCTYYVASQIAVPNNWGNASSWAYYARLSGWDVSSAPTVGAIAQTADAAGGQGHVAIIVGVNGNMVEIKDMNNYGDGGGWDRVGEGWVSVSTFQNYITH